MCKWVFQPNFGNKFSMAYISSHLVRKPKTLERYKAAHMVASFFTVHKNSFFEVESSDNYLINLAFKVCIQIAFVFMSALLIRSWQTKKQKNWVIKS